MSVNFTEWTGRDHWEVLLRARAIENGVYVLAPAQIGGPPGSPAFYQLSEPWYLYEGTGRIRDWLRESPPPPWMERSWACRSATSCASRGCTAPWRWPAPRS